MAYLTRKDIINGIDSMPLYEGDYEAIVSLLNDCDDTLFVKIIEEIENGNLDFSDFKPIFASKEYSDMVSESISRQSAFHDIYVRYAAYLSSKGLMDSIGVDTLMTINSSIVSTERKNAIYSYFLKRSSDSLTELMKDSVIKKILTDPTASDNFLLSADEYIVPIDYGHIELNESDLAFAKDNGLSVTMLKKIKSLSLYFGNIWHKAND